MNYRNHSLAYLTRIASFMICSAMLGGVAVSQAQTSPSDTIEEIVVTARKQKENLQEVPLTIVALTSERLRQSGVSSLRDIASITPGLTIADFGAGFLQAPVLRGMVQQNTTGPGETNVAIFIDGVYVLNNNSLDLSLANIERVEIVKGPQSALYGRNSFAGAINYVTRAPGAEFGGDALATLGSDGRQAVTAGIEGGALGGKLRMRLAGGFDDFDGTYRDRVTGVKLGGYEKRSAQFTFGADPTEALTINGGLYYADDTYAPQVRVFPVFNCAPNAMGVNTYYCGNLPDGKDVDVQYPAYAGRGAETGNSRDILSGNLRGNLRTTVGSFDLLVSYTDIDQSIYTSLDRQRNGLPFALSPSGSANLFTFTGPRNDDQDLSLEFRYSSPVDRPVRVTFGGYYFDWERRQDTDFGVDTRNIPTGSTALSPFVAAWGNPGGNPNSRPAITVDDITQKSLFGSVQWDLSERLKLAAEARYTKENKAQNQLQSFAAFIADSDGPNGVRGDWSFSDYRLTGQYFLRPDRQLYASVATGSKAGGFNGGAAVFVDKLFDPEQNTTYEVGLKADWLNKRLRTNVSAFFIDWTDIQLAVPATPPGAGQIIKNFGKVGITGLELEASAALSEGISLSFGLAYSNPEFSGRQSFDLVAAGTCRLIPACAPRLFFVDPNTRLVTDVAVVGGTPPVAGALPAIKLDGQTLNRTSKWIGNIALDIKRPLAAFDGKWSWYAHGDYRYESKQYGDLSLQTFWGPRNVLGARFGIRSDRYDISAWGNNITDDSTAQIQGFSVFLNTFSNAINAVYPDRRTFGITATAKF